MLARFALFVFVLSLIPGLLDAQPPGRRRPDMPPVPRNVAAGDFADHIGAFLDDEVAKGRFSGAVVVARHGRPLFGHAWGLADRETGRPNTLDTPINIGSMNKMFTGLAIGQLQARGKLGWHETVGKHLPNFPNQEVREKVTIHQLLTHTSGVPMYWNDAYEARKDDIDSLAGVLETFVDEPLDFPPGEGRGYTNGGPVILGLIVESITGQSYFDYVREHIYRPARMTRSDHFKKTDRDAGIAIGYGSPQPGAPLEPNTPWLGLMGSAAGGGYATAGDLLRFARAIDAETLLDKDRLEVLWKPRWPADGPINYGYLWGTSRINGHRWVGHNGGGPGVSADFRHYPELGYTIIVLANRSRASMAVSRWINELIAKNP